VARGLSSPPAATRGVAPGYVVPGRWPENRVPLFSPKGWDNIARGNAPGGVRGRGLPAPYTSTVCLIRLPATSSSKNRLAFGIVNFTFAGSPSANVTATAPVAS